jgi:hypothetical protein
MATAATGLARRRVALVNWSPSSIVGVRADRPARGPNIIHHRNVLSHVA